MPGLSSGLHLLRLVAVIALLLTAACDRMQSVLTRLASVKSVEVSPVAANVLVGHRAQLTALPRDSRGRPLPVGDVTWASGDPSVATVSDSGLVTAVAVGVATITATTEGQSGTGSVTVSTASSPPTNEPPGLILISEQPWDCLACNGWGYRAEHGRSDVQVDSTAPRSPSSVLRIVFPPSMPRDAGPSKQWLFLPTPHRWRELYVAYWIKWGNPWDALEQGAKVSFVWAQSGSYIYALLGPGVPPYELGMVVGWSPYGYSYGDRGTWHPNVTRTPIVAGQWYFVEEYFKYPTRPGESDGVMRWWVNGTLNGDYRNVIYPPDGGLQEFAFPFTRQATPTATSYVFIDHTRVSGRP